jgi:hypothetical protein
LSVLVVCPHCDARVLPMAGRICPACRQNVDEAPAPPPPEQFAEDAYDQAAQQMLQGAARSEILDRLTQRGLDADSAVNLVDRLKQIQAQAKKLAAKHNMFYGALWCIGGIVVTMFIYQAASNAGGGPYIIAWGAILYGGFQFLRGLAQFGED